MKKYNYDIENDAEDMYSFWRKYVVKDLIRCRRRTIFEHH